MDEDFTEDRDGSSLRSVEHFDVETFFPATAASLSGVAGEAGGGGGTFAVGGGVDGGCQTAGGGVVRGLQTAIRYFSTDEVGSWLVANELGEFNDMILLLLYILYTYILYIYTHPCIYGLSA